MILRNTLFNFYPFYATASFKLMVSVYRIAKTRYSSGEKGHSFIRNVFFNIMRDLQGNIINMMLLEGKGIPSLKKLN